MILKYPLMLFVLISLFFKDKETVTLLKADGPGNTYELINNTFGNGSKSVIEAPGTKFGECDNHSSFVNSENTNEHITEIVDPDKGDVFQFELHIKEDRDHYKCGNGRQTNEIKTQDGSPEATLGNIGEKVTYAWSMKIPEDFKLSKDFTHFHQIRSKGGIKAEERIPLITLTGYNKSNNGEMHIRHAATNKQTSIAKFNFNEFRGNWINFIEIIEYEKGKKGSYQLIIQNRDLNKLLFSYKNDKIVTYKKDARFMSPKWGISRKVTDTTSVLRDEKVLFGAIKIIEEK